MNKYELIRTLLHEIKDMIPKNNIIKLEDDKLFFSNFENLPTIEFLDSEFIEDHPEWGKFHKIYKYTGWIIPICFRVTTSILTSKLDDLVIVEPIHITKIIYRESKTRN